MTFDYGAVSSALRRNGLDVAGAAPEYLGKGRWLVVVCGRMGLSPQGTRVVAFSDGKWTVGPMREPKRAPDVLWGGRR